MASNEQFRNVAIVEHVNRGKPTPVDAMIALQERGALFVEPTSEVYAGMMVGENSRLEDMDINISIEKQLTNMRAASADSFVGLTPPEKLSLKECLESATDEKCVEVTSEAIRIRKVELDANVRVRHASKKKRLTFGK